MAICLQVRRMRVGVIFVLDAELEKVRVSFRCCLCFCPSSNRGPDLGLEQRTLPNREPNLSLEARVFLEFGLVLVGYVVGYVVVNLHEVDGDLMMPVEKLHQSAPSKAPLLIF